MPTSGTTLTFPLPIIESGKVYSPASLAREIRNFEVTEDGTLRALRGPCLYEPIADAFGTARPHGIYHAALQGGMTDMLLVRMGDTLYRHRGWSRNWESLATGLNDEGRQRFPDQFCEVNGRVIWTNGVDRARVIDQDAYTYPLGYDRAPSPPSVLGPTRPDDPENEFPNTGGYSHPGNIGTLSAEYAGEEATLLAGSWQYFTQWEAIDGNLSPLSPASEAFLLWPQSVETADVALASNELVGRADDLTRQALVRDIGAGPPHTVAIRLYRTRDTQHNTPEPHLRVRLPTNADSTFPDARADGRLVLGEVAQDLVTVPTFKIMCPWQGGLAIANTTNNAALVMLSAPGLPGTFPRNRWILPDPSGGEVTALYPYRGLLLAFTDSGVFAIHDDAQGLWSEPVSQTIGCVAPSSVKPLPDGSLIWLARDGFYRMAGTTLPDLVSEDKQRDVKRINWARATTSVAAYNPVTREYICATPRDSGHDCDYLFVYDVRAGGLRTQQHGIHYAALTVTRDWRQLVLAAGSDRSQTPDRNDVFVLYREARQGYTIPTKTYFFESAELRADAIGRKAMHVKAIYVGLVESDSLNNATLTWYRDGRFASSLAIAVAPRDSDYAATWGMGQIVIGTDTLKTPKLFWRRVGTNIQTAKSVRFTLEASEPTHLHVAAFAFDADVQDIDGGRVPGAT